jgi:hypothetical protein
LWKNPIPIGSTFCGRIVREPIAWERISQAAVEGSNYLFVRDIFGERLKSWEYWKG